MAAKYETGTYYGRGFSSIDPYGFLALLDSWIKRTPALGGAGWYEVHDQSTVITGAFTVDTGADTLTLNTHGLYTGQEVCVSSSVTLPTGLAANATYFVIRIDADTFRLAHNMTTALAGTPYTDITTTGSGIHTVYSYPYKVYCNVNNPVVNQVARFKRFLYSPNRIGTGFANNVRIMDFLWWDATNKVPRGIWNQHSLDVHSSTPQTYHFVGNTSYIALTSSSANHQHIGGTWDGVTGLTESTSVIGSLTSGVSIGSGVVLTLNPGEAANFTVDSYYYIYDFDQHTWVDYVKVTATNPGLNQITIDNARYNYPSGAVIGAYPHRYYVLSAYNAGGSAGNDGDNLPYSPPNVDYARVMKIPYYSGTGGTTQVMHGQYSVNYTSCTVSFFKQYLDSNYPDDNGFYPVHRPAIMEDYRPDNVRETVGRRTYGKISPEQFYVSTTSGLAAGSTERLINGVIHKYFMGSAFVDIGTYSAVLVQCQNT